MEEYTIKVRSISPFKWTAEIGSPHYIITTGESPSDALQELVYRLQELEG